MMAMILLSLKLRLPLLHTQARRAFPLPQKPIRR